MAAHDWLLSIRRWYHDSQDGSTSQSLRRCDRNSTSLCLLTLTGCWKTISGQRHQRRSMDLLLSFVIRTHRSQAHLVRRTPREKRATLRS